MNYRHAFHAGNHADVLKHAVLAATLAILTRKPKPLVVIDAFAGAGAYDLALDERADRTGEWRDGVAKFVAGPAPEPFAPYRGAVAAINRGDALRNYPGSPLVAQALLRPGDKLLAVELQSDDAADLERALAGDRRARVYRSDGWAALASFLPPTPRRGLVLVDPPFERPDEFDRMVGAIRDGARRWASGVFAFWYPIVDRAAVDRFEREAVAAAGDTPCLRVELMVKAPDAGGLIGSGLVVLNPPYGAAEQIEVIGAHLAEILGDPNVGRARVDWLTPPR